LFASRSQEAHCHRTGSLRQLLVGFVGPLPPGIEAHKDGRVVADALGDRMDRNASVEEGGGVNAPQIVNGLLIGRASPKA